MAKEKIGRPTTYNKKVVDDICKRIAQGQTILQMCRINEDLPSESTVYSWLLDDDKKYFLENYEKARVIQAERMAEELIDIADDGHNDYMERELNNGGSITAIDQEHIQRSRLRVDTRKWVSARLLPKKYGDKIDVTTKGEKLPQPIIPLNVQGNDSDN